RLLQSAPGDLAASHPEEFAIGGKIAPQHLARLHQEPPRPFHPCGLHPAGRAPDDSGEDVEAAANSHDHGYVEALAVALAPSLLERARSEERRVGKACRRRYVPCE